jgi:hypothetical protein
MCSDARYLILLTLNRITDLAMTGIAALLGFGLLSLVELTRKPSDDYLIIIIIAIITASLSRFAGLAMNTMRTTKTVYYRLTQGRPRAEDVIERATKLYRRAGLTEEEIGAKISLVPSYKPNAITSSIDRTTA